MAGRVATKMRMLEAYLARVIALAALWLRKLFTGVENQGEGSRHRAGLPELPG
jgi:hypothetical protein